MLAVCQWVSLFGNTLLGCIRKIFGSSYDCKSLDPKLQKIQAHSLNTMDEKYLDHNASLMSQTLFLTEK